MTNCNLCVPEYVDETLFKRASAMTWEEHGFLGGKLMESLCMQERATDREENER